MREEFFAWCDDAAIGAPEIVDEGWDDAIMHVAGDEEVEFAEVRRDFGVGEVDWRMDDCDFDFVGGEFGDEFGVEFVEVGKHDVAIFAAGVQKGGAAFFVAVELIIFGRLGEAKNINIFVFVDLVVEDLDVGDFVEDVEIMLVFFGIPMAFFGKNVVFKPHFIW